MADFSALKTSIQNYIKQNGNEEITGNLLQQILLSMVSTLGDSAINSLVTALNAEIANRGNADTTLQGNINSEAATRAGADNTLRGLIDGIIANIRNGYVYAGIATPSTTPVSGKVFYFALTAGTYTNFGATVVPQGINILKYNGETWSLDSLLGLDDAPTQGSNNLVKSGGVLDSIIKDGSAFDLSAYNSGATYADLSAALTALNALPAAYKKGGMSFKYVQTSDNKYVQWRLMSDTWSIVVDNWQGVDDEPTAGSENLVKSGGVKLYVDNLTKEIFTTQIPTPVSEITSANRTNGAINVIENYDSDKVNIIELFAKSAGSVVIGYTKEGVAVTPLVTVQATQGYNYIQLDNTLEKPADTYFTVTDASTDNVISWKEATGYQRIVQYPSDKSLHANDNQWAIVNLIFIQIIKDVVLKLENDVSEIQGNIEDIQGDIKDIPSIQEKTNQAYSAIFEDDASTLPSDIDLTSPPVYHTGYFPCCFFNYLSKRINYIECDAKADGVVKISKAKEGKTPVELKSLNVSTGYNKVSFDILEIDSDYYFQIAGADNVIPRSPYSGESYSYINGSGVLSTDSNYIFLAKIGLHEDNIQDLQGSINKCEESIETIESLLYPQIIIPTYHRNAIDAYNIGLSKSVNGNEFIITMITDLHIGIGGIVNEINPPLFGLNAAIDSSKAIGSDVFGIGGDLSNNRYGDEEDVDDGVYLAINKVLGKSSDCDNNRIVVRGNHEFPLAMPQNRYYNYEGKAYDIVRNPLDKLNSYGYIDFDDKKIRFIFLDTSRIYFTGQDGDKQRAWLKDVALNMGNKTDYTVIIFTHEPLYDLHYNDLYDWSNYGAGNNYRPVLAAFHRGTSITYKGEVIDFTQQGAVDLIYICGHTHGDYIYQNPDNYMDFVTITTRDCSTTRSSDHMNAVGTINEVSFDTYIINTTERKIHIKRYGLGDNREADFDYPDGYDSRQNQ